MDEQGKLRRVVFCDEVPSVKLQLANSPDPKTHGRERQKFHKGKDSLTQTLPQ